jgi:hypothetical protein
MVSYRMSNTYPIPREVADGFSEESNFRNWIAGLLGEVGWGVSQEVTSKNGNCRADIIAVHERWGKVGIECKYENKDAPRAYAEALQQVERYKSADFGDRTPENWVVAVTKPMPHVSDNESAFEEREWMYSSGWRQFFNTLGIGTLRLHRHIEFTFNYSNPRVKIPIASVDYPTGRTVSPEASRILECETDEAVRYLRSDIDG